jgi:hypothetical protein
MRPRRCCLIFRAQLSHAMFKMLELDRTGICPHAQVRMNHRPPRFQALFSADLFLKPEPELRKWRLSNSADGNSRLSLRLGSATPRSWPNATAEDFLPRRAYRGLRRQTSRYRGHDISVPGTALVRSPVWLVTGGLGLIGSRQYRRRQLHRGAPMARMVHK